MEVNEFLTYRDELLEQATDEYGFFKESLLLSEVLPLMLDAKLVDSEDFNDSYESLNTEGYKVNAYGVNESGERLYLFIVDEASTYLRAKKEDILVSTKITYDNQFKRCISFVNKAVKGQLSDQLQDSSPARPLTFHLSSFDEADKFDVIEIFLISATATVSLQATTPQPKRIEFKNETLKFVFKKNGERKEKSFLLKKRLIDLNFLHSILVSQGNREPLKVDFETISEDPIYAIKAADEGHFESYLCVFPAPVIAGLYKEYSTRLLEKNVRSFLQFKGVNKGIRETIRKEPEKFVAYNNGLTITATSAQVEAIEGRFRIKELVDFQIVNGGQTTATIYFTKKDGYDISKVRVMAKINVAKETTEDELEELISNISTYSNAQSRVSKVDLRSRNPQLIKIKTLSESIVTPSGVKWFFEKAKGEFNTKLRMAGNNKARVKKEYPNERRFSKEQLAKYYCAWGEQPYLVKKGGEKVFRYFIEELCGEGENQKPVNVNRNFYEQTIAKIILFRKLEKLYGQGKNSMGQLRSAVVPYTIATLYKYTDGGNDRVTFNLSKIWKLEKLEDNLEVFSKNLLVLMNKLIKQYAKSDDFGEYSKKEELWMDIITSPEVKAFMTSVEASKVLDKYTVS